MRWPWIKEPSAPPRVHVVTPQRHVVNLKKTTGGAFRNGMWVVVGELRRAGILRDSNELGVADVMLVQEDGTNLLEVHVPLSELTQAKWLDIPESRRPNASMAAAMGYEV